LHDLLRVYARERAHAEDPVTARQAALTRLLDHYRYGASVAMNVIAPQERHRRPAITRPDHTTVTFTNQAAALAWLDTERANLMTVATHHAYTVDLSVILWRYLKRRIHIQDALRLHTRALRIARQQQDLAHESEELRHIGLIHFQLGQYPDAVGHLLRSLALCRHADDRAIEATTLSNLGLVRYRMGQFAAAMAHQEQALALGRSIGDQAVELIALDNLGMLHARLGDPVRALEINQQALTLHRALGNRSGEAVTLNCQGALHQQLGDPAAAADLHRRALVLHREQADPVGQAEALTELGHTALSRGRPAKAVDHLNCALSLVGATGERWHLANIHYALARAHHRLGHHRPARNHCRQALDLYHALGAPEVDGTRTLLATLEYKCSHAEESIMIHN
jgi:tetratricopeptide (TPR) repeat protein